jgi:serine/threonine protein kinase
MKYIPGGTLDNKNVPFQFKWLRQLTQLVDFLNLQLGIMHQDIASRNLLIDPNTDSIRLFDFDRLRAERSTCSMVETMWLGWSSRYTSSSRTIDSSRVFPTGIAT